jgi:hypothetical protein
VADAIDRRRDVAAVIRPQSNRPSPEKVVRQDFAVELRAVAFEQHARAGLQFLTWMDERFPFRSRDCAQKESLDSAAAWNAMPKKPGGKNPGVIDDQEIAGSELIRHLRERRVFDCAGRAMQDEQSRRPAGGRRLLRNQLIRKFEIEVGDVHLINILGSALAPTEVCSTS